MSKSFSLSLLALLGFVSGGAAEAAAPQTSGSPFAVSSCPDCRTRNPAISMAPTGEFLAAWQGEGDAGLADAIPARLFRPDGSSAQGDLRVSDSSNRNNSDPYVVSNRSEFLIVWSSSGEIWAQRFSIAGERLGNPHKVNLSSTPLVPPTPVPSTNIKPVAARTRDGAYVVAWLEIINGNSSPRVLARRFDAVGRPLGDPVAVSSNNTGDDRPTTCVDTAGRIVVAWSTVDRFEPFLPSRKGVQLRRLSASLASAEAVRIVAAAEAKETNPVVSCGRGNTFVVAWQTDRSPALDRSDVVAQRFTRLARKVGPTFVANVSLTGEQKRPAISHEPSGSFVLVWENDANDMRGIVGRRFAANGAPLSQDFVIAPEGSSELTAPAIAHGADGRSTVVWQEGNFDLFGQRLLPAQ